MAELLNGSWRPMLPGDLAAVSGVSDAVHGRFSEDAGVYAERLSLYPAGCFVFERDGSQHGYLISHPWLRGVAPPLNAPIGAIPPAADTFYLHDVALLPSARGSGAGKAATDLAIRRARAAGFADITLMAVNGADRFWSRQGFVPVEGNQPAAYGPGTCLMRLDLPAA